MIEHGIEIDAPNTEVTLDERLYTGEGWTEVKKRSKGEKLRATSSRLRKTTFPNNIPLPTKGRWPVQSGLPSTNVADIRQGAKILAGVDQETEDSPEWIDGPGVAVMDQDDPQTTAEFEEETKELLETLPEYCHDYLDIFRQEQGTKTLPPHREYDMKIDLQPTSKMPVSKLYPLAEHHRRVLLETLDRETKAGRIRQSNAAYGSPMFFVPKKDGRSRMVVDYRRLNENTVPDVYPLPLISQITNELGKANWFTKLDLVGAYQLLRMAKGFEHLTAFRTQYGMYESLVVRDGLRNAPAVFQHFLNDVFKTVLGKGVTIYIDDILIYASTLEELKRITLEVFELVRKSSLYLKASKCEFEKASITFLGFIISNKGIETDPSKVDGAQTFPIPKTLRQARGFIGLVGYYRRFVKNFSSIAAPITELTKKDRVFEWTSRQQDAFDELKRRLISAPILAHFVIAYKTILQTDASFYGWGFIISQVNPETGLEHPIVIESGRFSGAQLNYSTNEKEFLAIIEAFRRCRHMLLQVHTTVLTDHLNLKYWMEPRDLNPRQARWVEILSPFRMSIVYRPGRQATMPDALSRRADYHPSQNNDDDINKQTQALPSFDETTSDWSNVEPARQMLRALQTQQIVDENYHIREEDIEEGIRTDPIMSKVREDMMAMVCFECDHPTCKAEPMSTSTDKAAFDSKGSQRYTLAWSTRQMLTINSKLYVPDYNGARVKILKARHDSPMVGHPGITKTMELVSRDYTWKGMRKDIETYIGGCAVCQRTKVPHSRPHGLLKTLEVPTRPWSDISMDFVEPLPKSKGYDSILVVVDRLTKWAIFLPTTTRIKASDLADILLDSVFTNHGFPTTIVSDRGSKFTSKLWKYLTGKLGISLRLSTAFHPQTDGQTERVNQSLEAYLRIFTSYKQDDWSQHLGLASFTYNNTFHSAIKTTPFYANYGYHPRWVEELQPTKAAEAPEGLRIAESILDVHRLCQTNIMEANKEYANQYDKRRKQAPVFKKDDWVMLSMKNINTKRPSKKLDIRQAGPYQVIRPIGTNAYEIRLPSTTRIHNVFNVSLLHPYNAPKFAGQTEEPPGPVEITDDGEEFEVSNVVDSRLNSRSKRLEYLVEWKGYEGTDEQTTWEPAENLDGAQDMIADYHRLHPEKPSKSGQRVQVSTTRHK
jgi:transposase InsO family protein